MVIPFLLPLLARAQLDLSLAPNGDYSIYFNGVRWFTGGAYSLWKDKVEYTSKSSVAKLAMVGSPVSYKGEDSLGTYSAHEITWNTPDKTEMVTTFRSYGDAIVFQQHFPKAIKGTSSGNKNGVVSVFPALSVSSIDKVQRGLLQYQGDMAGAGYRISTFDNSTASVADGISGGPLVIFSKTLNETVVISPFSQFMGASQFFSTTGAQKELHFGILGAVDDIPEGFTIEFILKASKGIARAMMEWGDVLLARYGKDRYVGPYSDPTLNYLGYSTDNGAYYYYYTEPGKNYEETMLDVRAYADKVGLPYQNSLLDSWWYYKGVGDGVKNWTARPDIFPSNLDNLFNKTGWIFTAHNRYWAADTSYAKQNGGQWDFIIEGEKAVPVQQEFWDFLMLSSRQWGMRVYEQDWLDTEFDGLSALHASATLGRTWLLQMGAGAEKNGLTIQYCMAYPRHVLQSVEIPSVTQARASGDYSQSASDQWAPLGVTSLFTWALGVAPSKDNFWSTDHKGHATDNPRYVGRKGEPYNRLQSAVITLSRGPVAPGDMIGASDVPLIMRSATKSGRLLQHDQPAFAIDAWFLQQAFGSGGPPGRVWGAKSRVGGEIYASLLAVQLSQPYTANLYDIFGYGSSRVLKAFEANSTDRIVTVTGASGLPLAQSDKWTFQFFSVSPVLVNGWTLLGEPDKWVSVSHARFSNVEARADGVRAEVKGTVGEKVTVGFLPPTGSAKWVSCVLSQSQAAIVTSDGQCFSTR